MLAPSLCLCAFPVQLKMSKIAVRKWLLQIIVKELKQLGGIIFVMSINDCIAGSVMSQYGCYTNSGQNYLSDKAYASSQTHS